MKYYIDNDLRNFQFWSGAKDTVSYLTDDDLDTIEFILDDGRDWSETEINDFFWFENDIIAEWLGYKSWEHMIWSREDGAEKAAEELAKTYPDIPMEEIEDWVDENWTWNEDFDSNCDDFECSDLYMEYYPAKEEEDEG